MVAVSVLVDWVGPDHCVRTGNGPPILVVCSLAQLWHLYPPALPDHCYKTTLQAQFRASRAETAVNLKLSFVGEGESGHSAQVLACLLASALQEISVCLILLYRPSSCFCILFMQHSWLSEIFLPLFCIASIFADQVLSWMKCMLNTSRNVELPFAVILLFYSLENIIFI